MNKKLQDLVWSVLPKEFKEEVKYIFFNHKNSEIKIYLIHLFGKHNLISDADGEEMLTVSRKEVQNLYNYHKSRGHHLAGESLIKLFGSKCLPDDTKDDTKEPKPAEPKFKRGDRVRIIKQNHPQYGKTATVDTLVRGAYPEVLVNLGGNLTSFGESDLEPYTEPEADNENPSKSTPLTNDNMEEKEHRNLSQETANCDKHFDTILKGSFRNERRLNIAVQILSGIVASSKP